MIRGATHYGRDSATIMSNSIPELMEILKRQPGFLKAKKVSDDSVAAYFYIQGASEPCLMIIEISSDSLSVFAPDIYRLACHNLALRFAMVCSFKLKFGCFLTIPGACTVDYICQVPWASRFEVILRQLLPEALRAVTLAKGIADKIDGGVRKRKNAAAIAKPSLGKLQPLVDPSVN